jgi:hypothetical protein
MAEPERENENEIEGEPEAFTSSRLRRARRLLGLPAEPPNIVGMLYIPIYGRPGIGGRLGSLSDEERERERARYHAEDFRARLASTLADTPPRLRSKLGDARWALNRYRAQRAFANARTLYYTSHYIHPEDDQGIDGYFDLGPNLSLSLEICTSNVLKRYAKAEWAGGEVTHSQSSTILGSYQPWLVVPGKKLTDELIAEAIRRWYQDRFEFVQGHWSQRQQRLPKVVVNLEWQSKADQRREHEEVMKGFAAKNEDKTDK